MQQRRGTAAQWLAAAPVVLAAGEIGFETDTNQFKMGDGTTEWQVLSYFKNLEDLGGSLDDYIPLTQKGIAGGVPTLDSGGLIPLAQLPGAAALDAEVTSAVTAATTALTTAINTADAKIDTKHGVAMSAITAATSAEISRANAAYDINGAAANALTSAQSFATTAADAAEASALADANDYTNTEILAAIGTEETNRNTAIGTSVSAAIATEVTNRNTAIDSAVDAEAILRDAAIATQSGLDRTYTNTAVSTLGTTVDNNLTTHIADTTNIHGIADTSVLATATTVATAKSEAITAAGTAADTKVSTAVAALTKSSVGLANADNTSDANKPISSATQTALDLKSPLASPTFTGTVTTGHVLPATDITYDLGSPAKMWRDIYVGPGSLYVNGQKVLQTDAGDVVITADVNENLALRTSGDGNIELDPTGSGSVTIKAPLVIQAGNNISNSDGNAVNFGAAIKTDTISSKTANTDLSLSADGTGKVYLNDNAEVSGNLVVGGNLTVSGTTTTVNSETISLADNIIDLNSNFTSGTPTENSGIKIKRGDSADVQMRWNESTDKWDFTNDGTNYSSVAGLESPTFTGTVSGVTKSMVALGNVDNTSDVNKPVSTATQTALDAKLASATAATTYAPISSPTFTGTVTLPAAGIVFSDGTQAKVGVPSVTTFATALSASGTLATGEQDKFVPITGAVQVTLPATGYSTGQSIDFYQASGTGASFAAANSVVGTPGLKFRTTNSVVTAMKTSSGWLVFGDLSA